MAMSPLRDILNDTAADATDVEFNFNTIESHIRTELIDRSGVVAMTGPLTLAADPTNPMEAATKQYVDATMPVAIMFDWPVTTLPLDMAEMWRICDGAILNVAEHTVLFARIGSTFNRPGDAFGGTQFRLPDFRKRVSVGWDGTASGFDAIGFNDALGVPDVVVPIHNHPMPHTHPLDHNHGPFDTSDDWPDHGHGFTTGGAGGHTHSPTAGAQLQSSQASTGFNVVSSPGAGVGSTDLSNPGDHVHGGTTIGANARHHHSADAPPFAGPSGAVSTPNTSDAGVAATNKNYPPYLVLNKIIKVL